MLASSISQVKLLSLCLLINRDEDPVLAKNRIFVYVMENTFLVGATGEKKRKKTVQGGKKGKGKRRLQQKPERRGYRILQYSLKNKIFI